MNFFDQIQEALEKQQSPEGTPLPSTSQEQQKTTISLEQLITLQPRTKTAKDTFVRNYRKTGLSLGTPVHAKEYTEQFKKNNNTVLLTETKRLDIVPNESDWDDDQDFTSHGDTAATASSCSICRHRYSAKDHYTHQKCFWRSAKKNQFFLREK